MAMTYITWTEKGNLTCRNVMTLFNYATHAETRHQQRRVLAC